MLLSAWHSLEVWLFAAVLVVSATTPAVRVPTMHWYGRIARRQWLAVGLVTGYALIGCLALGAMRGAPLAMIHDEFAYLLQADTFAHGRLANPPHPMSEFFETFHVLQQPTYMGKYPPAQGMFLGIGQALSGYPVAGVWLSFCLASGALCWMLQAWIPPRWALLGALLFVTRLLTIYGNQNWAYGYWGGAVAMLGGALVFGAVRRLCTRPSEANASLLAIGLVVLANARPLEGAVASLLPMLTLAWQYLVRGNFGWQGIARLGLPILLIGSAGAATMAVYNHQITGHWARMPYREHLEQYTQVPVFFWQKPLPVTKAYPHPVMTRAFANEGVEWERMQSWPGYAAVCWSRIVTPVMYFFGYLLLPFFLWGAIAQSKRHWLAMASLLVTLICGMQTAWFQSHYLAPVAPCIALAITNGMRSAWYWRWGEHRNGRTWVQLTLLAYIALLGTMFLPFSDYHDWQHDRAAMIEDLSQRPGKHLVIVAYSSDHNFMNEWVYNQADIDGSNVVWAREVETPRQQPLLDYYHDRTIWRVHADEQPPRLEQLRGPIEAMSRAEPNHER